MFYRPQDGHGLPHNPFNAIITPRPIGWISSRDSKGVNNLAPYSFFNGVAYTPPQVMFASTGAKPDQDHGAQSRLLAVHFALEPYGCSQHDREEQPAEKLDLFLAEQHGLDRVPHGHALRTGGGRGEKQRRR